eukprot:2536538-Rhodomonas_salina.1
MVPGYPPAVTRWHSGMPSLLVLVVVLGVRVRGTASDFYWNGSISCVRKGVLVLLALGCSDGCPYPWVPMALGCSTRVFYNNFAGVVEPHRIRLLISDAPSCSGVGFVP